MSMQTLKNTLHQITDQVEGLRNGRVCCEQIIKLLKDNTNESNWDLRAQQIQFMADRRAERNDACSELIGQQVILEQQIIDEKRKAHRYRVRAYDDRGVILDTLEQAISYVSAAFSKQSEGYLERVYAKYLQDPRSKPQIKDGMELLFVYITEYDANGKESNTGTVYDTVIISKEVSGRDFPIYLQITKQLFNLTHS